jgi:hypothetical protein
MCQVREAVSIYHLGVYRETSLLDDVQAWVSGCIVQKRLANSL